MHYLATTFAVIAVATAGLAAQQLGDHHFLAAGQTLEQTVQARGGEVIYATVTARTHTRLVVELCDENGKVLARSEPNQREHRLASMVARSGRYQLRIRNAGDVPTLLSVEMGR